MGFYIKIWDFCLNAVDVSLKGVYVSSKIVYFSSKTLNLCLIFKIEKYESLTELPKLLTQRNI